MKELDFLEALIRGRKLNMSLRFKEALARKLEQVYEDPSGYCMEYLETLSTAIKQDSQYFDVSLVSDEIDRFVNFLKLVRNDE